MIDNIQTITSLAESAALMKSDDFKDRFRAEVIQLDIRREKLRRMLRAWDLGRLSFTPKCSRELLGFQLYLMDGYYRVLCRRAEAEGIEL